LTLAIETPDWALPLIEPRRYKGAKGGRASGKSHFFAEEVLFNIVSRPNVNIVCVREIQKSLKFSAKKLIEDKIQSLGVSHLFDITLTEIRHNGGVIIFQGLQDHTADSIKSLEGFDYCWVEEAQSISKRSLEMLIPTIRKEGSEIWFSWNPTHPDDPIEEFFNNNESASLVHVNYLDNPYCPDTIIEEAQRHLKTDSDTYGHVWLGEYLSISDALVFNKKYEIANFEVNESFGEPLFGLDFGFAIDPTAAVCCYIKDNFLFIRHEASKVGLELDYTAEYIKSKIPNIEKYVVRADSARPESISYLKRHGIPRCEGVDKWAGSIEDGVSFMRSFEKIIIHTECVHTQDEFRKYSYKIDKRTGDILPKLEDKYNHIIDAIRYALTPLIKNSISLKSPALRINI